MKNRSTKFISVGGCGRSGTTLLQRLLLNHHEIEGGPEFGFTQNIMELFHLMRWHEDRGDLKSYTDKEDLEHSFREFYEAFFKPYLSSSPSYIAEKTPSNIFTMDKMSWMLPDTKFICMYRDGRAVLSSHVDVRRRSIEKGKFNQELGLARVCALWNKSIEAQLKWQKTFDEDQLYSIRYEDLVSSPERVLKDLMTFLDLEMDGSILEEKQASSDDLENTAHLNDIWYTQEMLVQNVNTDNVHKWKKELSLIHRFRGNVRMAINLQRMGYPISSTFVLLNRIQRLTSLSAIKTMISQGIIGKTVRYVRMKLA